MIISMLTRMDLLYRNVVEKRGIVVESFMTIIPIDDRSGYLPSA